jgi:hypothetical protein
LKSLLLITVANLEVNGGEHRNRSIIRRDKDLCKGQHLQTRKENLE